MTGNSLTCPAGPPGPPGSTSPSRPGPAQLPSGEGVPQPADVDTRGATTPYQCLPEGPWKVRAVPRCPGLCACTLGLVRRHPPAQALADLCAQQPLGPQPRPPPFPPFPLPAMLFLSLEPQRGHQTHPLCSTPVNSPSLMLTMAFMVGPRGLTQALRPVSVLKKWETEARRRACLAQDHTAFDLADSLDDFKNWWSSDSPVLPHPPRAPGGGQRAVLPSQIPSLKNRLLVAVQRGHLGGVLRVGQEAVTPPLGLLQPGSSPKQNQWLSWVTSRGR